jgi:uncharacterized membrane protein
MDTRHKNFISPVVIIIATWLFYSIAYSFLRANHFTGNLSGLLPLIVLTGLNITASIYSFKLWRKTSDKKGKLFFAFFSLAFLLLAIDDFIYNTAYNVLHLQHANTPFIFVFIDNLAFSGYLVSLKSK